MLTKELDVNRKLVISESLFFLVELLKNFESYLVLFD